MRRIRTTQCGIVLLLYLLGTPTPSLGIQELPGSGSGLGAWSVDPTPVLSIGMVEGPDEYLLLGVKDASQLSDGTIVVGMSMRNLFELRYYDSHGKFLASVGRYGGGPFESRAGIVSLERFGDSVLVVGIDQRYSLWGPAGEPVRSGRMSIPQPSIPWGLLDNGHLGLVGHSQGSPRPGETSETPLLPFYILDLKDQTSALVATLPTLRTALAKDGLFLSLPFEPRALWATGGGYFWMANSGEQKIRGFSAEGNSPAEITLAWGPEEVSGEDRQRWKEHDLEGHSAEVQQGYRSHHRGLRFPQEFPVFQDLEVDTEGNLWVLRYEPPWSTEDYQWDVFEADGTRIATAHIPYALHDRSVRSERGGFFGPLLEIGNDYLLIEHRDDLGVQFIRKYELTRGG